MLHQTEFLSYHSELLSSHVMYATCLSIHGDSPGKNTGVGCHAPSRGSSQHRDWTQLSRIAGVFFTIWATREEQIICLFLDKSFY